MVEFKCDNNFYNQHLKSVQELNIIALMYMHILK